MSKPTPTSSSPANGAAASSDDAHLKWYQGVDRYAWIILAIAAMGWLFDTMDQNLFNLVRQQSLEDLLRSSVAPEQLGPIAKQMGGTITAIFLLGWAAGGFIFGMLGDKLGRARTMSLTILIYAAFTGLTGLTHTVFWYTVCRFMTALGVGGEFAAGAALVAEVFPNRSRPMALGTLQSLSAVGNMSAAVITYGLSGVGESWRWAFAIGATPAILVFFIRRMVREPEKWVRAQADAKKTGQRIGSIVGLFEDPVLRRNTIAGTLLAVAGIGGLWGVGFFLPDLNRTLFQGLPKAEVTKTVSVAFFFQQFGGLLGMFSYALLAERMGRKPALLLFFILGFGSVEGAFHFIQNRETAFIWSALVGFCALAPFSAYAVYFPELFPTRLRATGTGFCYNCARVLAALAPFALGSMARAFASATDPTQGLRTAASIVACVYIVGFAGLAMAPETKGKPLPE